MKHLELMKERRKALSAVIEMLDAVYETQTVYNSKIGLCPNIVTALIISMQGRPINDHFWEIDGWISKLTFQYFKLEGRHGAYPVEGNRWDYEDDRDKYNPQTENGRTRLALAKGLAGYLREIKWRTW